LLLEA